MAESKSVVFDLSQDRLAYWGNFTRITFNNSELRGAWKRAKGYIRSQVVEPLLQKESSWTDWTIEANKLSGTECRLGGLSRVKIPTQHSYIYVPMDVCSIIDSREAWGTQFDQANLKYVAGSDSLATDVPAFANYFYLLQCFIPGIFTIPTQVGSIALPPTTWVEANKDALLHIFGEMKLRALRKAVAQRREDFIPSKSEPTPLFLPKEKKGKAKAQGSVAIQQAAPALSYQVIFDLSDPAIARWKTHAQLGWHFDKIARAWKRAKKTFIPDNILQPLHKEWTDLTGSADRSHIAAKFQRVAQPAQELYVPNYIQFPGNSLLTWKQRFESAGIKPSNTPSLELDNSIPPLTNFFYLLQCLVPGIFVIASSNGRTALLPPTEWITDQQEPLTEIFGQRKYLQLKDAATNKRIGFFFFTPPDLPPPPPPLRPRPPPRPAPTKTKQPKKQKAQTSMSSGRSWSSPSSYSMGSGYDWTACDKDCGWCGNCWDNMDQDRFCRW